MLLVKKYPNRRLYDTRSSRYITLDDLAKTVRTGEDVSVQDAQNGRDITQETLTQIILDRNGGKLLPASLLLRLIRLDDAALGEFLTRYVSWALEVYLQARGRARALLPLNPLATAPFAATDALARLVLGASTWGRGSAPAQPTHDPGATPPPDPEDEMPPPPSVLPEDVMPSMPMPDVSVPISPSLGDEMARLRQEIDALKASMSASAQAQRPRKRTKSRRS